MIKVSDLKIILDSIGRWHIRRDAMHCDSTVKFALAREIKISYTN